MEIINKTAMNCFRKWKSKLNDENNKQFETKDSLELVSSIECMNCFCKRKSKSGVENNTQLETKDSLGLFSSIGCMSCFCKRKSKSDVENNKQSETEDYLEDQNVTHKQAETKDLLGLFSSIVCMICFCKRKSKSDVENNKQCETEDSLEDQHVTQKQPETKDSLGLFSSIACMTCFCKRKSKSNVEYNKQSETEDSLEDQHVTQKQLETKDSPGLFSLICFCKRKSKFDVENNKQSETEDTLEDQNVTQKQLETKDSLGLFSLICFCKRKSKSDVENNKQSETEDLLEDQNVTQNQITTDDDSLVIPESLQYEFADIEAATNNFSKDNKIGRGGFGVVYKGTLTSGQQIAVKRLSNGSGQGDKEFQTEIVLLAKLQHPNLVRLLGFCIADDEALLVYELVTNKSLDYFLFDDKKRAELNWPCRFQIIKGIAEGMVYLHEDSPTRTMHRDLKAGNILLDAKMCPKIADFGMARICDAGQTHINPTRVVGTHGYMAPEYLFHGQFSAKSDVYSLGVLILEIVSGRRVSGSCLNQPGGESLLGYVWRCWEDENPLEITDPMLKDSCPSDEVLKCVQLGLLCVQENSNLRPKMSAIVNSLNSNSSGVTLSMPQQPAYIYSGSSHQTNTMSSNVDTTN